MNAVFLLLLLLFAVPAAADDLETLASWMVGSFSSAAQADADSNYFDIRLEMAPIWTARDDGIWLYVEQAVAGHLERPYRQRVYRLSETEGGLFRSEAFSLPEPLRFTGAHGEEAPLTALTPDSLGERSGCAVELRRTEGGEFAGSTIGNRCMSQLRGASYATSQVVIRDGVVESWDRGFDADGEQVWGAENGAYVFRRMDPHPEAADSGPGP